MRNARIAWVILIFVGAALPISEAQVSAPRASGIPNSPQAVTHVHVVDGQVIAAGEPVPMAEDGDPTAASAAQIEQQKLQLLLSEPFTRNSSQVLQAWLLGPDIAWALASGEAQEILSAEGQLPPPMLNVPGENKPFTFTNPNAAMEMMQGEVEAFRRLVTLGNWTEVQTKLAAMSPQSAKQVFEHILNSFAAMPGEDMQSAGMDPRMQARMSNRARAMQAGQMPQMAGVGPNYLTPDDVVGIADLAPEKFSDEQLQRLAHVLRNPIQNGFELGPVVKRLQSGSRWLGGVEPEKRLAAAKLFLLAEQPQWAAAFLPEHSAIDRTDIEVLETCAQRYDMLHQEDGKPAWLEQAWELHQAIVQAEKATAQQRATALEKLVVLAPKVKKEIGQAWLDASFRDKEQIGRLILSLLGTKTAVGMSEMPYDASGRTEWLRLQTKAVDSLLELPADETNSLRPAVTLLAMNWLLESQASINLVHVSASQPYMQVDVYGNYYWVDPEQMQAMQRQTSGEFAPVEIRDLLEVRPDDRWTALVDPALQLAIPRMTAGLFLAAGDETEAFPHIESIAQVDQRAGQDLVDQFLDVWTSNHDPNNDQRMRNRYIYFYGFDAKADSIPLTRSKQERNLVELRQWVQRIRKLPIEEIDEKKLARAFTTCHSSAEVFKMDAIEGVFGDISTLKPETVASICQTMRMNLASVWRNVRTQEALQTKRREPEIQQEVLRGYRVAEDFARRALEAAPDNWQLTLTLACLAHDQNDYAQSVAKSSEYSEKRLAAFASFADAARKYSSTVISLEQDEHSTEAFDYWFYAALGAVDLGNITDETVAAQSQFALIRQALLDLPGEVAADHMSDFANQLFTRMSPIKPELKFRYLKGGFEIVGDHPRAVEARKLFQYYQDLMAEIQLVAEVDGSDVVGHDQPFGVFVCIRHTHEIERESSGFAKYVQNQNSMMYAYNYGRPNEDYRDKFEKAVREDLAEHFEVLGITFENPKNIRSRPDSESGWRVTPYAYILLQPLGPHVDKLPPIKLDLDFLDTSGFVVMPIASSVVPIDASSPQQPRPYHDLNVVQTLDERQASDGKLLLEIKATAKGLVPELTQILPLEFDDFDVGTIDGQPVLATEFDPESEEIQMLTDRSWVVELTPKEKDATSDTFVFPSVLDDAAGITYQRYQDADLVKVEQTVTLERTYAQQDWSFLWWLIPLAGLATTGLVGLLIWASRRPQEVGTGIHVPQDINPFTVLALLKQIRQRNGIAPREVPALDQSIVDLEEFYFGQRNGHPEPDLGHIAKAWVAKTK